MTGLVMTSSNETGNISVVSRVPERILLEVGLWG